MHEYQAPLTDMKFVLRELVDLFTLLPASRSVSCHLHSINLPAVGMAILLRISA